jgi:hypothetical protein
MGADIPNAQPMRSAYLQRQTDAAELALSAAAGVVARDGKDV